ncbi:MAG: Fur family transcriptional regulator, partial [Desulfonatronovibrionaceae bacterium]
MRLTKQRKLILQTVRESRNHPTATEVYDQVRISMPTISLGTVYRNLDILSRQGHIRMIDTCGDQKRFDARTRDHLHVICSRCGQVRDVNGDFDLCLERLEDIDSEFTI